MAAIIFGIKTYELTPQERQYLSEEASAGIILFTRNYQSPEQLKSLCQSIRHLAPDALICVDHEGGRVQRFKNHFTSLPSAAFFGEIFDDRPLLALKLCQATGSIAAYELRQYDIDFTFAPVLDLQDKQSSVIGERAFHPNPAVVSELSSAFRRGLAAMGMAAVGKHYPGHGRVQGDSHHILPCDERDEILREADIYPFITNIRSGIEAIMPAHILFPHIDPKQPAGFSPQLIKSLRDLSFNGAIITDDLDMAGASHINDPVLKVQQALDAGADTTLICNNFSHIEQTITQHYHHQDLARTKARLQRLRAKEISMLSAKIAYQQALNLLNRYIDINADEDKPWLKSLS